MHDKQGAAVVDPVDQLVPPPRGWARLVLLLAGAYFLLGLAAVAPMSGTVRPNLVLEGRETGSGLRGVGDFEFLVNNRGWAAATIERFDLGLAGADVVEATFLPAAPAAGEYPPEDPVTHGPLAAGPAAPGPVVVAPGQSVIVHVRFTYDCVRRGDNERPTVRARGITPLWFTVDLEAVFPRRTSGLAFLIDADCDHPS